MRPFAKFRKLTAVARARLVESRIMLAMGQNAATFGVGQVLRFIKTLILARLLMPEDFGAFALALSVVASLQVLSSFGFSTHFIASAPAHPKFQTRWLNTIWTLEVCRGGLVAAVLFLSAGPFGEFFKSDELPSVLRVLALSPLVAGLGNTGMLQFQKSIRFGPVMKRDILSNLFGVGVTIGLAFHVRDAIVLAVGLIAESAVSVFLSYVFSAFRPKIQFDGDLARKTLSFGKHLLVVGVLTYVTTQADNLVIGRLLGPSQLGYYVLAYSLAMMPVTVIGQIVNRVLLPYYSEEWTAGGTVTALQRWKVSTRLMSWLIVAIATLLFWNGGWLISVVYGSQWLPATAPFAVLTLGGAVRGFTHTMSPMLIASDRPDVDAKCKIGEVFLFLSALYVLVPRFGTVGAAYACLTSYSWAWLSRLCFLMIRHKLRWRPFLQMYLRIIIVWVSVGLAHPVLQAASLPAWAFPIGSILLFLGFALAFEPLLRELLHKCQTGVVRPSHCKVS